MVSCELLPFALKWARHQSKLTQVELSQRTGISLAYIGMLETGHRRRPDLAKITVIADALGVQVTDLVVILPTLRASRRSTDPTPEVLTPVSENG